MKPCLLLTSWYFPIKVLKWQDAITQLYLGKAEAIVNYEESVSSPSISIPLPAVMRIVRETRVRKKAVKFSRINVYTRDGFCCQYCGVKKPMRELSYDHVIPRAAGGQTTWDNVVTACKPCNARKGDQSCEAAGMFPRKRPARPTALPLTPPQIDENSPVEWKPFVKDVPR